MVSERVCEHCQKSFRITRERESNRKFCSAACMHAHQAIHGRPAARVDEVEFACKNCGGTFTMGPSYAAAYRVKYDRDPFYCSMACSAVGRRKSGDEKHVATCKNCGNEFQRTRRPGGGTIYREQVLCSKQCKNEWVSKVYREKHGLPKITRQKSRHGYVKLRIPAMNGEPAQKDILEHRYVMEQHLGRKLYPEETVHHKNGYRKFNEISNLELFSSRHGPGQRVIDKLAFCAEMVRLYPDLARKDFGLIFDPEHEPTADPPSHPEPRQ